VDRDTANKYSEGTPKEKLKRRRRRRRRTPPPQLPPEERKRFPKPRKVATRKISKEIRSLKRSRDEIQLAGSTNQPREAKFGKGKCEGDQRHPKNGRSG
jgi:hypothetical protein